MVADARLMLGDPAGDLLGSEEPLALEPLAAQELRHQRGQRPRSQAATGMPKPFLGRARIDAGSRLAAARLSSRLVWFRPNLNDGGKDLDEVDQLGVQERGPDLQPAGHAGAIDLGQDVLGQVRILVQGQRAGQRVGAPVKPGAAAEVLGLDADRVAVDQQPGDLGAGERAQPALVGQRERLGRAAEKLLELEIEAEIAVIDRQPADRRAGQRLGRPRQAAEDAGRALGREGRIAGQQLVGAVAAQDDLDLLAGEPAQR